MATLPAPVSTGKCCQEHHRALRGPREAHYCPACASAVVAPFVSSAVVLRLVDILILACSAGLFLFSGLSNLTSEAASGTPWLGQIFILLPIGLACTLTCSLLIYRFFWKVNDHYFHRRLMGYWYDGSHCISDVLLVAGGTTVLSVFALFLIGRVDLPGIAGSNATLISRGLQILLLVLLAVLMAISIQREYLAPAGLFPRNAAKVAVPLYTAVPALLIAAILERVEATTFPHLSSAGAGFVANPTGPLCSAIVALSVAKALQRRWLAAKQQEVVANPNCPSILRTAELEAYVAIAGPPGCGKSTFLACAHQLMVSKRERGPVKLSAGEPRPALAALIRNLYVQGRLYSTTSEVELNTLGVELEDAAKVSLSWLDIPGALITKRNTLPSKNQRAFEYHLANADALILMIKARDLKRGENLDPLIETARRFHSGRATQKGDTRVVPLLVIVTQMCRLSEAERADLKQRADSQLREVFDAWRAGQGSRPQPTVIRVFFTSAVVTPPEDSDRIRKRTMRLQHDQVLQAIYWLTAQVLRVHMDQLAFGRDAATQNLLKRQVLWLEEAADDPTILNTNRLPSGSPAAPHLRGVM